MIGWLGWAFPANAHSAHSYTGLDWMGRQAGNLLLTR
jgi:hypothetical protein